MTQIAGGMPAPATLVECATGRERTPIECWMTPSASLDVHIRAGSSALVRPLQSLFTAATPYASDAPQEPARLLYEIAEGEGTSALQPRYRVRLDGRLRFWANGEDELVHLLERSITDHLMRSLTGYHLFHAGAVARNGRGIVLPAASGAGKSTMVAALALSGFDYYSDDVAVLGSDYRLRPFPKVISLRREGWERIALDYPAASQRCLISALPGPGVWYVRPPRLPDDGHARTGYPVDFVVFPTYDPSGPTELQPVAKSLALTWLVEQSLDLPIWGEMGFDLIVGLVQRAQCYLLTIANLTQAVGLLEQLTLQHEAVPS